MKFIYKFFILFLFFYSILQANVNINIPPKAYLNEPFLFEIEVDGNDIKFPNISKIDGNIVQEISSSSSTRIINSQISKKIKKTYSFYPTKDFTIPSFEFVIDGKSKYTSEKNVVLTIPTKTKSDIFDFSIKSSKNDLYVGENFILTLVFKYKKNTQIIDLSFDKPNFENFWYKQLNKSSKYDENEYTVQELNFLMFPLKNGNLKLNPILINAQVIDIHNSNNFSLFSNSAKNIRIYSNSLDFQVKKLPDDVNLIGKFTIDSNIDKSKIKQGEAISYKLKIEGIGNIDDIGDIKLDLKDALIYDNKPEIKTNLVNNKYQGTYEKVFSIVPNNSITIPAIKLKYFDKDLNKTIEIQTNEYSIDVEQNQVINSNVKLEKKDEILKSEPIVKVVEQESLANKILYFCLGAFATLLIFLLYFYFLKEKRKKQEYNTPLIKKIKLSKSNDELLKILVVHLNKDKNLDELIFKLEKSDNFDNLKKEIIKKIKELKL